MISFSGCENVNSRRSTSALFCSQKEALLSSINPSCQQKNSSQTKKGVQKQPDEPFPWTTQKPEILYPITKEFFRCKGSPLNPPHIILENGKEKDRIWDCGGYDRHGLPARNGEEFIYPALIEILNFLQSSLQHTVVITSGHRCPAHEQYCSQGRQTSTKHLIGAAVSFFIPELENKPEIVIETIKRYYATHPIYSQDKAFLNFTRSPANDCSQEAWVNKELFIKLYTKEEGRNLDNRHPFAYFDLQLRFDRTKNAPLTFTWQEAQNYVRK